MRSTVILDAEVAGRTTDIRIIDDVVDEIGVLRPGPEELVIEARGGALLPGLHDHHLHLLALAAASASVRCGPSDVDGIDRLARTLRSAPGWWVRGVGYHESVAGILDRYALDRLVPDRPVRIQHRGGALWMLNSLALQELRMQEEFEDGLLWRHDDLLRERLGEHTAPDLAAVGRRLAALGITGVTDATPNLSQGAVDLLARAELPQRVHLLGAPSDAELFDGQTVGPWKILHSDHEPPDWESLYEEVRRVHATGRPVAIHAVTRESLVLALAVLAEAGPLRGDRIEHASVLGSDAVPLLVESGATVITQPGFVTEREREYRCGVVESEHEDLYRYGSLLRAGVQVAPSSDAPYASEDPWRTIAAAATRNLAPTERVAPQRVLAGLLAPLGEPGGNPRRVTVGESADLCLLAVPLGEALDAPDAAMVVTAICAGDVQNEALL
ncbi:amidohydrolase family protein [Nocardia sp. CA-135398]|uniref:amidohydrolase family protein n=1 Tax=Nocardia sp. CA-135398 TaxID=3239977 RepID=UPI003D97F474